MEPKLVCTEGGTTLTHPANNISDLPSHRVGNCVYSRWELSDEERRLITEGGGVIIGMMTGRLAPYPIWPFITGQSEPLDQYDLVNLTKEMANGLTPEMLEPRGDNSEACLVHLTRGAWLGLMAAVINLLPPSERQPIHRMIINTLAMIEQQVNNQKNAVPTAPPKAEDEPRYSRPAKSGRSSDNVVELVEEDEE